MIEFNPKPLGLRNIKTAAAVFLCIILLNKSSIFATVASVICMQDTVENSVKMGKTRLIGTLIGGLLGILFLSFVQHFNLHYLTSVITAVGVMTSIYICNFVGRPPASSISSIVLISIMLAPAGNNAILYATNRTIETAIGIVIAILVNKYLDPSFFKKKNKEDSEI